MAELRKDLPGLDEVHILHALYDAGDRADLTILVRGFGTRVEDANGRRYLDGMSGVWNTHLGYGRQELVEAAAEQMRELAFGSTYSGFTNVPAIQLAARLQAVTAQRLQATFFTASGADANEAAFKTARYYWRRRGKPEKTKILSLEHGFHGLTLAAMSATGIPAFSHMFQPVVPHFVRVPGPYPYRCDFAGPGETPAEAAVRRLDEAIRREEARTVAAFIVEPVQGPGGVIVLPADYFPRVRELCDHHQILLIADEVITGFGRTGRWFGSGHWGVPPDILTFAKGITSGYLPLGGMLVAQEIADVIRDAPSAERWMHASTYSGHPVCCAVALRALEIIEQEGLVERVARLGEHLLRRLRSLLDLECVGEVRGLGLLAGVELVADRRTKAVFDPGLRVGDRVRRDAQQAGLLVRNRGDVINLAPPFVISEGEIEELVAILREAIEKTQAEIG